MPRLHYDAGPLYGGVQLGPHGYESSLTRSLYGPPDGPPRTQVLSYGGGKQTAAICALIIQGRLPRPDHIIMADTGREKQSTFDYLHGHVTPALARVGLHVEMAPHSLSTVDLFALNGQVLMPMYSTQGGQAEPGKLATMCSGEWKTRVIRRYMRGLGLTQVDTWIGFSPDEAHRLKLSDTKWTRSVFPLMDLWIERDEAERIALDVIGALPPKSSCTNCPNQGDEQWLDLTPDEVDFSEREERLMPRQDPHVFLHQSALPIREAIRQLRARHAAGETLAGEQVDCQSGGCWI